MRNLIGAVVVGVSLFAGVAAAEVYVQVNVPVPVIRVVAPAPTRVVVYKPGHRKYVRVDNRGPRNNGNKDNGKHRR